MKKNAKEIIDQLSSGPVQKYILENQHADIRELVLRNKALFSIPVSNLSEQIGARRKAREKLPVYYETPGIVYPPSENFEQSSSQATSIFKRDRMAQIVGNARSAESSCADLTGGFGVDTFFLSQAFNTVHYIEPVESLLELARHNHELLGAKNIFYHNQSAEAFLSETSGEFDFVYVDPSRRSRSGKVHGLADSVPDILKLKSKIFEKTTRMVVKASPLLDIQAGIEQLDGVERVSVVSVNNECKELLFFCGQIASGEAVVEAVDIQAANTYETFNFSFAEERGQTIQFGDPLKYLYEPNASILKAGAFKSVASRYNLVKISPSTHLYTSATLLESFPGRKFEIEKFVKPNRAELKDFFPEGKANVTTRNYPLTPKDLKKKTGLMDGGDKFLIGFSGKNKKHLVVAKRL